MSAASNVAVVEGFLGRFLAGDLASALPSLAEDFVSHEPESLPYAGDHHGHDGFTKLAAAFGETWEITGPGSLEVLPAGDDRVLGLMELDVVARSTGAPVHLKFAELYTVRDGKITDVCVYSWDTAAMNAALAGAAER